MGQQTLCGVQCALVQLLATIQRCPLHHALSVHANPAAPKQLSNIPPATTSKRLQQPDSSTTKTGGQYKIQHEATTSEAAEHHPYAHYLKRLRQQRSSTAEQT